MKLAAEPDCEDVRYLTRRDLVLGAALVGLADDQRGRQSKFGTLLKGIRVYGHL